MRIFLLVLDYIVECIGGTFIFIVIFAAEKSLLQQHVLLTIGSFVFGVPIPLAYLLNETRVRTTIIQQGWLKGFKSIFLSSERIKQLERDEIIKFLHSDHVLTCKKNTHINVPIIIITNSKNNTTQCCDLHSPSLDDHVVQIDYNTDDDQAENTESLTNFPSNRPIQLSRSLHGDIWYDTLCTPLQKKELSWPLVGSRATSDADKIICVQPEVKRLKGLEENRNNRVFLKFVHNEKLLISKNMKHLNIANVIRADSNNEAHQANEFDPDSYDNLDIQTGSNTEEDDLENIALLTNFSFDHPTQPPTSIQGDRSQHNQVMLVGQVVSKPLVVSNVNPEADVVISETKMDTFKEHPVVNRSNRVFSSACLDTDVDMIERLSVVECQDNSMRGKLLMDMNDSVLNSIFGEQSTDVINMLADPDFKIFSRTYILEHTLNLLKDDKNVSDYRKFFHHICYLEGYPQCQEDDDKKLHLAMSLINAWNLRKYKKTRKYVYSVYNGSHVMESVNLSIISGDGRLTERKRILNSMLLRVNNDPEYRQLLEDLYLHEKEQMKDAFVYGW